MAKLSILAGATSQSVSIFIQDSTVTTGAGKTGLAFNTSGLIAYYAFNGANGGSNAITLATLAAANSAFSSGGFKEIDSTNMPGLYRLDIPNAAIAGSKGRSSVIMLSGATGMAPCLLEIELTGWDNQVAYSSTTVGTVTTVTNQLTAAAIATGVWQDSTAGDFTTASSIGKSLYTSGVVPGGSAGLLISGTNSGTTTLGALTCTGSFTVSDGLLISRSSSNTSAITATGNGTGSGAVFTSGSGATGDGIQATCNSTNGNGLTIAGKGTGPGLKTTGGLTGIGLQVVGGGTSGNGIDITTTSGHGISSVATGTTKHGGVFTGGATTSNGISATGGGVGHGILATSGGGATGDGIQSISAATNGNGFNTLGKGTGAGLIATGGLTGPGQSLVGGGTSGDGLIVATTSGHGLNIAATGTTKHGATFTGGATTSDGIRATGGGTGHGLNAQSGSGATGNGINAKSNASNGDGMALVHAGTGTDLDATTTPLTLAKTTNITGFNDIAASAIVSSGAITTSGGKVSGVILTDTVTTYTGNTVQTGDSYARIGAPVGASISADIAAVKSSVGSPMQTYTQPTGFLAATFPSGTIANTTNITAGTITTATNTTNAPTAGDFTTTMKTSLNAATPAVTVSDKTGFSLSSGGNNSVATAVLTNTMTESYPTAGAAITLAQGIHDIVQQMNEKSISGTTLTIKKRDQSTAAKTFTLNDATSPTAITETT